MEYIFKCKKSFFWKSYKIDGHKLQSKENRMDLFFKDGSIISLSEWSKYDLKLGQDWLLRTKKDMERESGLDIKLKKGV